MTTLRITGKSRTIVAEGGRVIQTPSHRTLIVSSMGAPGPAGTQFRNGSGVPSNALGLDGDLYLNDINGDLYRKVSGSYVLTGNIQGPQGPGGDQDLRKLIFLADQGGPLEGYPTAYREIIGGVFPSLITWYTDNTKVAKIVDKAITRNPNKTPATITYTVYQSDGVTQLHQAVDTISYSGVFETSRERVFT